MQTLDTVPHSVVLGTTIFVFDMSFKMLPLINVSHPGRWSPAITTSKDYIFITAGINCENFVMRISKLNHSRQVLNRSINSALGRSTLLGDYLFAVSTYITISSQVSNS